MEFLVVVKLTSDIVVRNEHRVVYGVVRWDFEVRSETLYIFTPYTENPTVQCTVGIYTVLK